MPKEEVGKLLAIAIGIFLLFWLLYELLKSKEDVPIYRCPACGKVVRKKAPKCYYCGTSLIWGNPSPSHSRSNNKQSPNLSEYISKKAWNYGGGICASTFIGYIAISLLCAYCPPVNISPINTLLAFLERFLYFSLGLVVAHPLEAILKQSAR